MYGNLELLFETQLKRKARNHAVTRFSENLSGGFASLSMLQLIPDARFQEHMTFDGFSEENFILIK